MIALMRSFFQPRQRYEDPLTQQRAVGLLIYLGVGMLAALLATLNQAVTVIGRVTETGTLTLEAPDVVTFVSPALVVLFFMMVRRGYYRQAAIGVVALSLFGLVSLVNTPLNSVTTVAFLIPIVTAGVLLGWGATLVTLILVLGVAARSTLFLQLGNTPIADFFLFTLLTSIITALTLIFGTNVRFRATRFVQDYQRLIAIINELLGTGTLRDEAAAIQQALDIVRDRLRYTFAQVYLVDDGEVTQRAQPSLNQARLNIDTNITLSSRSAIYDAIRLKQPIILGEGDDDSKRQHMLSGAQGAVAIPFTDDQGDVIGVLDVQSEDHSTFTSEELEMVSLVARQLGQTVWQLRQRTALRKDLQEQDELIANQKAQLAQYERAERETTIDTWRTYLDQRDTDFLGFDLHNLHETPVEAEALDDALRAAIEMGDITVEEDGAYQNVKVPIRLRGQSLGAMTFRVPHSSQTIGARQQDLIRNVVQRLSLALENKRLFEQSRAQAKRERKANEVGNSLLGKTDIEAVLALAATNFQQTLGAVQTQIRIEPLAEGAYTLDDEDTA